VAVCPTNFDEKVECPFVDRKEFIEAFENAFQNIGEKDYSVLVYYGVAGIGKTSLRKELPSLLEKHNESDRHRRIIWTSIDFATEQYRQPYKFLEVLSSQLRQEYGIKFNSFDIALAIYNKKVNPHNPLVKENYSEESIVRDVLDIFDEVVPANLISNVLNLAKNSPERYQKWATKRKKEISELPDLETSKIYERLPVYWAHDLADHLQNNSESAVIFIDTYEALWEKERERGSFNSRDEWLRKLIENIQKSCLWIICGREELRWKEVDEDWENYLNQREIGKLPEKDALYLLEQCGITEEDIQKALIESSEGVPYYLELSIDTYRKIKKRKQPAPEDFAKVPNGIFCRFVKYLDREEKETLKVLSVPRYWDRELFEILVERFKTEYPATSFSELHGFSFITVDDKGKCSMHQLMRKSLQEYQDQELKEEVHGFMCDYYSNQIKNLDIKSITSKHENTLNEAFYHAKETLKPEKIFLWASIHMGIFYNGAFLHLIAHIYEEILEISEKKLGSENIHVAAPSGALANIYQELGDYEKALGLYKQALKITEKNLGCRDPNVANIMSNLATLHLRIGNHEKSLPLYKKALEIHIENFGEEHPEVATTMNNLASFYENIGDYRKAIFCNKQALCIREKVLDPNHLDIAKSLNNIASNYILIGNYLEALPLCEKSLEISEKSLSKYHPYIGTILNNLAGINERIGNYEEALSLYSRSLEIREKTLGKDHPDVAITLNNLAGLYENLGNFEEALINYQRTLEIRENTLGLNHPLVSSTLSNLALVYYQMGNFEEALSTCEQAINIQEKNYEEDHPQFAISLGNMAIFYSQMGNYEEALKLYQRSHRILEKLFGTENLNLAANLNNVSDVYSKIGDYNKALLACTRALEIREKVLGECHPEVATTLNNLSMIYLSIGKYNEAFPLIERAIDIIDEKLGILHPKFEKTIDNFIVLCETTILEMNFLGYSTFPHYFPTFPI